MNELNPPDELLSLEEQSFLRIQRRRRKLVLSLCVAGGLISVGFVGVRYLQNERDYARKREAAFASLALPGAISPAVVDGLREVVHHRADDIDAWFALARATLRCPQPKAAHLYDAARIYMEALRLAPRRDADRRDLVNLFDLLGESDLLTQTITPLLENHPDDAALLELQTLHLLRLGKGELALASARLWTSIDPGNPRAYLTCLTVSQFAALPAATRPAETQPTPSDARTLSDVASSVQSGALSEASALLDGMLANPSWDRRCGRYVVYLLDQLGRPADADRVAQSLDPSADESLVTALALRDLDRGDAARALQRLERGPLPVDLSRRAAQLSLLALLASQAGDDGLIQRTRDSLEAIPVEHSRPWTAALQALTTQLDGPSARALLPLLNASARVEEGSIVSRVAMSTCLAAMEQRGKCDRLLAEAARSPVGWSLASRQIIQRAMASGDFSRAGAAARWAYDRSGKTVEFALALVKAVAPTRPTGEALEDHLGLLREIHRALPGEVSTIGPLVQALVDAGKADEARSALRAVLDSPTQFQSEQVLEWTEVSQQNGLDLELELIARAQSANVSTPAVALARARVLHHRGQTREALDELRATAQAQRTKDFEVVLALFLSEIQSPDAVGTWASLAATYPHDMQIQTQYLAVATDVDSARAVIERIRSSDPASVIAELAEIKLELQSQRGPDEKATAIQRLIRLTERHPARTDAATLLVQSLLESGQTPLAVSRWETAYAGPNSDPMLRLIGAQLFVRQGQYSRAVELLDALEPILTRFTADQRVLVAQLELVLGRARRAASALEKVQPLERKSKLLLAEAKFREGERDAGDRLLEELLQVPDLRTLLFAASVSDSRGDTARADSLLRSALELATQTADEQGQLAEMLAERGELGGATTLITSGNVSDATVIRIAARCVRRGLLDAGMTLLKEAVGKSPEPAKLARRIELEPRLRELTEQKHLTLAGELLEHPDATDVVLLTEFAHAFPSLPLRAQQKSLDSLAQQTRASYVGQLFVAAERYLAVNQPSAAERAARRAAELDPASSQPLLIATLAALQANSTSRCSAAIREWRDRLPADSSAPDRLHLENLVRAKRYTEILDLYEARVRSAGPSRDEMLMGVAEALIARGRSGDARMLLEPFLATGSAKSMLWMDRVLQRLDPATALEALLACERLVDQRALPAERIRYAVNLDKAAQRTGNQAERARAAGLLNAASVDLFALPTESIIAVAEYHLGAGDVSAAGELCRRALAGRPQAVTLRRMKAQVDRLSGDWTSALTEADEAIRLSDRNPLAHEIRAACLMELHRYDEAVTALTRAVQLDPFNPRWQLKLAEAEERAGNLDAVRERLPALQWLIREPDAWPAELTGAVQRLAARVGPPPTTGPTFNLQPPE